VTGSAENTSKISKPGSSGLWRQFLSLWHGTVMQNLAFLLLTLGAATYSIQCVTSCINKSMYPDLVVPLVTRFGWPPVLHLCYITISTCLVPIAYAVRPPIYPDRQSALVRNKDSQILFPRPEIQDAVVNYHRPSLGHLNHLLLVPFCLILSTFVTLIM
jgi:hypothetical protein